MNIALIEMIMDVAGISQSKIQLSEEKKQLRLAEILRLEKLRRQLPSKIKAEGFRIYYVRYADDFLIGINGNEVIAKTVKLKIEKFSKLRCKSATFSGEFQANQGDNGEAKSNGLAS